MRNNKITKVKKLIPYDEYIDELSRKSNIVHITHKNSKTGPLVNDLAFPTCTCREDAPCKICKQCYCLKGTQQMSSVLGAYTRNLRLYQENQKDFFEQVEFYLKHIPLPMFRWFDCGDIPDYRFFDGMVSIAEKFPDIKFMSFTKKYEIVNEWLDKNEKLPDNLTVRFSMWDKCWDVPNPHGLPVAYVDFTDKHLNPEFPKGCVPCWNQHDKSITCGTCRRCWDKRIKAVKFIQH